MQLTGKVMGEQTELGGALSVSQCQAPLTEQRGWKNPPLSPLAAKGLAVFYGHKEQRGLQG